jgi:hypothetical protein
MTNFSQTRQEGPLLSKFEGAATDTPCMRCSWNPGCKVKVKNAKMSLCTQRRHIGGVGLQLQPLLFSALVGGESSPSRFGRLTSEEIASDIL